MQLRMRCHLIPRKWKQSTLLILVSIMACIILTLYAKSNKIGSLTRGSFTFNKNQPTNSTTIENHPSYLIYTSGCKIPDWNPYDDSLLDLITEIEEPYNCQRKPSFLEVKFNTTITVDQDILTNHYHTKKDNISCTYKSILRDSFNAGSKVDKKFRFGNVTKLRFDVPLNEEFLEIKCSMGSGSDFADYIPLVPLKPGVEKLAEKALRENAAEEKLNINMIGIDSVSRLNFLRHFKKTYSFMKENCFPIEMLGYTKIADNTFPNVVALLTGQFLEHYWNESKIDFFCDKVDIIWKNYSKRGYRTLFAEDNPNLGIFSFMTNGFLSPPTDYYLRPFVIALEKSKLRKFSKEFCYQSKVETELFYNYHKDFANTMGHRNFFAFTMTSHLTHDDLNNAGYADDPTYRLLRNLSESGILNRSLTILFSDHGIRFGPIRETYIGKLEERMPFMFLIFPSWFLEKYPKIAENLKINERRLTTPFDIHATLAHLLNFRGSAKNHSPSLTPNGISLFTEIPESRTCSDAAILPHWCTCHMYTVVSKTDNQVVKAAEAMIDTINKRLKPYSDKCVVLQVNEIIDARVGQQNEKVMRFVRHENHVINRSIVLGDKVEGPLDYLLTVSVLPSGGIFEATVRFENSTSVYTVLDDISRINRYGHQSKCLISSRMEKFCYCKELTKFG